MYALLFAALYTQHVLVIAAVLFPWGPKIPCPSPCHRSLCLMLYSEGLGHQFSSGNSDGDSDAGAVDSMDPDMAGLWRGSSGDFEVGCRV